MPITHKNLISNFAVCINTDDSDLLTPRMIYQVLPDESAAKSGYIRVIDNEGEDYLYPARIILFRLIFRMMQRLNCHISYVAMKRESDFPKQSIAEALPRRTGFKPVLQLPCVTL